MEGRIFRRDKGEPTTGKPRVSIAPDEEAILSELAAGKDVLEVGTGYGVSTAALCKTARLVFTVDPDPAVKSYVEKACSTLPALLAQFDSIDNVPNHVFDLVFIDGDHSVGAVVADIKACLPRLKPGGLMLFHDSHAGNVLQGIKTAGLIKQMDIRPTTYGLGMWTKP